MDQEHDRMTLSVTEAAKRLGISRAFAYELVVRGELPCLRFGRRVVVPRKALERLVNATERPTRDDSRRRAR
jgi:excisionase family DNA binding protein